MPTPEEELETLDQALAEIYGPIDPNALFKLGQAYPDAPTVGAAIQATLVQPDEQQLQAHAKQFHDAQPRSFQGVTLPSAEAEQLASEQERETPTFVRSAVYSGDLVNLNHLYWRSLADLENPRLRSSLRDSQGREEDFRVREVPLAAFLTFVLNLKVAWIDAHVFIDPPVEKVYTGSLPLEHPDLWVKFTIAYSQAGVFQMNELFQGSHSPPPWLLEAAGRFQTLFTPSRSRRPNTR